jgi:hypothetical protein
VFQLLFDPRHDVLMTRLFGTYVESDITLRDKAVARFVARHGKPRGIMDFSGIEAVDVSVDMVVRRSAGPALLEGRTRVIVAPREPLWALNRIFAAHRFYRSGSEPILVRSLDEAYRVLAIDEPAFSPIELDPVSRLEGVAAGVLAGIEQSRGAARVEEHERTRRTLLRLLDTVMTRPAVPEATAAAITLSDVLNAALRGVTLSDADLKATCPSCKRRRPLSRYVVSAGRETTYACPACGRVTVVLAALEDQVEPSPVAYELGRFSVRTAGDIECPGACLPKCEP